VNKFFNYVWRLIATAISFTVFGVGGIILSFLVFPVFNMVTPKANRKIVSRRIISRSFRAFVSMMQFFGMFDFDVDVAESVLSQYKGKVIVANHPSLIDVVVLISIIPHADCIVKKALWDNPFLKGVVKAAGYIKNSENPESLMDACRRSLNDGYSLIIFPEGTRTNPGKPLTLQRGASNIALRCDADLVVVRMSCEPTTLTKNEPWYRIPQEKAKFSVWVAELIEVKQFKQTKESVSVSARKLTNFIKERFSGENTHYA
jgi:1-acyl-sn-glycerol-3-phosphate acyltransferase